MLTRRAEQRMVARRLSRSAAYMLDAFLTALYVIVYAYALEAAGYPLDAVVAITLVHVLLIALGWRNTPLRFSHAVCIMYRTGFLPIYASTFIILSTLYNGTVNEVSAAYSLLAALAIIAILRVSRGKDPGVYILTSSVVAGAILGFTAQRVSVAFSFAVPPMAVVISRPRVLCDDRPLLYVASLYSVVATLIVLIALGVPP